MPMSFQVGVVRIVGLMLAVSIMAVLDPSVALSAVHMDGLAVGAIISLIMVLAHLGTLYAYVKSWGV